ncbi:MAG TPA: pitrilysin family protein [Aquabacterium sp.]|nr:pitrilysin family protein [Aquabacterium sp.]
MSGTAPAMHVLANGVRLVVLPKPEAQTCQVSIFIRCGSGHERRSRNGIGHVIEHMAFKGTATRDARRINLDAERLGAEVNAHTDKDHTAFHMRGLAAHAPLLLRMLADIVLGATFPAGEFEQERDVLLHEFTEDADDPMSTAFKLFDRAAWGLHPLAQPVIGTRANIERFSRDDLVDHVAQHYTGANLVVAVAGPTDADTLLRDTEAAFGAMAAGAPNLLQPPAWGGGVRTRSMAGSSQTHLVLGFPVPPMQADDPTASLAAALLGEGMSSPLMDQLRERRGLVYYAACSADLVDSGGQFVIEASTGPEQLDDCLDALAGLVTAQASAIAPIDLERAKNQMRVRRLRGLEKTGRRLEEAALDALLLGRLRDRAEALARIDALDADALRTLFGRMAASTAALAATGRVPRATSDNARRRLAAQGLAV